MMSVSSATPGGTVVVMHDPPVRGGDGGAFLNGRVLPARSRHAVDARSRPIGRVDQRSPAKRSFSGMAAPVVSWTRTKVSMPINSPNLPLPILRKKMFSP